MEQQTPHRKVRTGTVVSDKMDKTVVVRVTRHAKHPLYEKRIVRAKKFTAHDENNECRIGDVVTIGETRPISKMKCWTLLEIVRRAPVFGDSVVDDEEEQA